MPLLKHEVREVNCRIFRVFVRHAEAGTMTRGAPLTLFDADAAPVEYLDASR